MNNNKILFNDKQKIVCFIGASGTGKSLSANFLKHFGYTIVPQITTRKPRPDDTHYVYYSNENFITELNNKKIIGYYLQNKTSQLGTGYGYSIETIDLMLQNKNAKLILFPSAYELNNPNFLQIYGNSIKIALTFKNPKSVITRAKYARKVFSNDEIKHRIDIVKDLTKAMLNYGNNINDNNFHIIYSDGFGDERKKSEQAQLQTICEIVGIKEKEYKIFL